MPGVSRIGRCAASASPLKPLIAVVGGAVFAGGCGSAADLRPGDVRTYRVPRAAASAAAAPASVPGRSPLRYDVPEGWSDGGGGGLRLATLTIGDPSLGHEVTVIPASGSLESNVARWAGQLEAADEEALAKRAQEAIAAGDRIDVDGIQATVVLLPDAAAADGGEGTAILGAIIPRDDSSSLFVKFKGPASVARRERDRFVDFVSSLRWK